MKTRQLMMLVVAALVLGGGGLWVVQQRSATFQKSKSEMGGSVLGEFEINAVSALRITQGSNTVNVVRDDGQWVVRERANYPANFGDLASFIRKLSELKVTRQVRVGASRLPMLELTPETGTTVELLGADGKALKTLRVGKASLPDGGGDPMMGGAMPDGRYVMAGETVALVSDPLTSARPRAADWISKSFIKVEQPVFVSVQHPEPTNSFTLVRTNEFAEWTLESPAEGESLDKNKLWSFNSLLSGPGFNDVVLNPDAAALGLDQPTVATIRTAGGLTYTLKIGRPTGEDFPVQVAVTGELVRERKPAEDEKPEDKERLDREFQEQLKKAEEKLKAEQAFGRWTYTVSRWTVESLVKPRSELLAAAPGETPSEEAPAPFPGSPGGGGFLPPGL